MKNIFKYLILLLVVQFSISFASCSKSEKKNVNTSKSSNTESLEKYDKEKKKYWINSPSMKRHNKSCRWYGNTKSGYFTNESEGVACKVCGG